MNSSSGSSQGTSSVPSDGSLSTIFSLSTALRGTLKEVRFSDSTVVWDDYNPYPKLPDLPPELVFISRGSGSATAFNETHEVTSGLQQILLMFGGYIQPQIGATLNFTPLLTTGTQPGLVSFDDMVQRTIFGSGGLNPARRHSLTGQPYTMAAHITGNLPAGGGAEDSGDGAINVVLAGDIDMLYSMFFIMRERGSNPDEELDLQFDNVTFILNVLDSLAGDDRFIEIRKRRPVHRTLTRVEARTKGIIDQANRDAERYRDEFDRKQAEQRLKFEQAIGDLQQRPGIDLQQMALEVQAAMQANNRQLTAIGERLARERDQEIQRTERSLALEIRSIQGRFKFAAVLIPPILPIVLAVIVYARRRRLEKIGVPEGRIRTA